MISLVALILVGITFAVLRAMIKAGNLTRNSAVGVRTSATLASDAAWVAGHCAAIPALTTGLAIFVLGVVAVILVARFYGDDAASVVGLVALLAGVLPVVIATFTTVKRAAESAQ